MSKCEACATGVVQVAQTDAIRRYLCTDCGRARTTIEVDQTEIYQLQSRFFYSERHAAELQLEVNELKRALAATTA